MPGNMTFNDPISISVIMDYEPIRIDLIPN